MDNRDAISGALLNEGAAAVGITPAEELSSVEGIICERGAKGYFGEMKWLAETAHKRTHPSEHMKGVRSIICSAWPYSQTRSNRHIARYAHHGDYHDLIEGRLRGAWKNSALENGNALFFVDSKPIAEKAYAERAGLGWIGKNSLLINPDLGSFFLLGTILTDVEFENPPKVCHPREGGDPENLVILDSCRSLSSAKAGDRNDMLSCGACSHCIDSCPTGALPSPGTVDSKRCISYLTIEHKGDIPIELRPLMGGHVFGCDICQEVCPYNRRVKTNSAVPLKDVDFDPLGGLMLLSEDGFRRKFEGTSVARIGRSRFLRNVAVALGNTKEENALSFLRKGLQDEDSLIRSHSEWGIRQIN